MVSIGFVVLSIGVNFRDAFMALEESFFGNQVNACSHCVSQGSLSGWLL